MRLRTWLNTLDPHAIVQIGIDKRYAYEWLGMRTYCDKNNCYQLNVDTRYYRKYYNEDKERWEVLIWQN